ncbi:MAG: hypothetical protein JWL77_6841 [Chthonomonadaceae bacterium]|nr:hypothetical protein [Chthonomonadaceae bacterium]
MAVLLLVIGLVVALAALAFIVKGRRQTSSAAARAFDDFEEGTISEPLPIQAIESLPVAEEQQITWTKQFEPRSGQLSDEARLRLINDLGLLRAPWCVPLLSQACEEEIDPAHRVAAQLALARCREVVSAALELSDAQLNSNRTKDGVASA